MKQYNYAVMMLNSVVDCKIADNYLINSYIGDEEDNTKYSNEKRLYVLINANGTKGVIYFLNFIAVNSECYIRSYDKDIGEKVIVFDIPKMYHADYDNIIAGNYKDLSKNFIDKVKFYYRYWKNIIDTRFTMANDVSNLIINIVQNSKDLIDIYWNVITEDVKWITSVMEKSGNYWSSPNLELCMLKKRNE